MRLQATARSGFGLLFGVSFAGGHSVLLQTVVLARHGEKETLSPKELNFKHCHGPQSVSCVIGPPDRDTQKSGVYGRTLPSGFSFHSVDTTGARRESVQDYSGNRRSPY